MAAPAADQPTTLSYPVSGKFLVKRPLGYERAPDTAGARHIDRVQRGGWRFAGLLRWSRMERTVYAILAVIGLELIELPRQVVNIPEEDVVQRLPPDRPDQSFDDRMRARDEGQGLHLVDVEHAPVGSPAMEGEQRISVGGQRGWRCMPGHGTGEPPADRNAITVSRRSAESTDTPRAHVHHHHHPVALESDRLASEESDTPEAVRHRAKDGQP
jgi:hypothetical protein